MTCVLISVVFVSGREDDLPYDARTFSVTSFVKRNKAFMLFLQSASGPEELSDFL